MQCPPQGTALVLRERGVTAVRGVYLEVAMEVVDREEEKLASRLGPHAPQPEREVEFADQADLA